MDSRLVFGTWNVQGLKNNNKRKSICRLLNKENYTFCALQETYLQSTDVSALKKEWKGVIHYAEGKGRSKGLLTLFNKNLEPNQIYLKETKDRFIISEIKRGESKITVINAYAPCDEREKILFLEELTEAIFRNVSNTNEIVCLGDFNIVANNKTDIISGNKHKEHIVQKFKEWFLALNLFDAWRECHPLEKQYTWCRQSIARRLDYIFVGETLKTKIDECEIINFGLSDHKLVKCRIINNKQKSYNSFYKLNTTLLEDQNYINMIKDFIASFNNKENGLNPHLNWELLKAEIKGISQQFSAYKESNKRNEENTIRHELRRLEEEFIDNPNDLKKINERIQLQKKLEIHELQKTRGAQIRAKIKWIEEGEKSTNFFLNLERSRQERNTIQKLTKGNGETLTSDTDIIQEFKKHYENIYKETNHGVIFIDRALLFTNSLIIPQVVEEAKLTCEAEITLDELHAALTLLKNGSSPGPDGIPCEFYKCFWEDIKVPFLKSLEFSKSEGRLSPTQRQGTFTLIHKGNNLPRDEVTSFRPISLTNADYKILSKFLAIRLKKSLESIIHKNQFGFMKGRLISKALRTIDDIIQHEVNNDTHSMLLSIDYAKAFDTISVEWILSSLALFGFGENFIGWIKTILADRLANIKNGGCLSEFFSLERGVRQGCPISPLLFIIAVEILAISIRQEKNIKGIQIKGQSNQTVTIKVLQYADDLTLWLKNVIDYREVLSKIKQFSAFTGLCLNEKKTKAMKLSKYPTRSTEEANIQFVDKIAILGITFCNSKPAIELEENWGPRIDSIERTLNLWAKRDLSIIGKIIILKTFALSKLNYVIDSIGLPHDTLQRLNRMFFQFIWKKKFSNKRAIEKISRKVLCNQYKDGGLKMFCMFDIQDAATLQWAESLLVGGGEDWEEFAWDALKLIGGKSAFASSSKATKGLNEIKNVFWKHVLQTWVKQNKQEKNPRNILDEPLFNNNKIMYQNQPLFMKMCIKSNILYVKDMLGPNGLLTYQEYKNKTNNYPGDFLDYNLLYSVLRKVTEDQHRYPTHTEEPDVLFRGQILGKIKRTGFLNLIRKIETPNAIAFWERKFTVGVPKNVFELAWKCTQETRLRTLQWKIINNIYPTNILLNKMGIRNTSDCTTCKTKDYIEHFFVNCTLVKPLWTEIKKKKTTY